MSKRVQVLVESQGMVVSVPTKNILSDNITEEVNAYVEANTPVEEVEVVETVPDNTFTTYTFKQGEEYVGIKSNGSGDRLIVSSHKTHIASKLLYLNWYNYYSEILSNLENNEDDADEIDEKEQTNEFNSKAIRLWADDLGMTNFARRFSDIYRSNFESEVLEFIMVSFLRNKGFLNYKNRNGIHLEGFYLEDKPSTISSQMIFEQPKTETIENLTATNFKQRQLRPSLNNIYDTLTICWGETKFSPILTTSNDIVESTGRLLDYFLTTEYNDDLSSRVSLTADSVYKAVARSCNSPETKLSCDEFLTIKNHILNKIDRVRADIDMKAEPTDVANTFVLLLCSALNIDIQDILFYP